VEKCTACDLCWIFCPDGTIRREKKRAIYTIDYEYCKGCGICAEECPQGVIELIKDEK
jgi:pyruvate ferredoxin oxidoreductase delta subunit